MAAPQYRRLAVGRKTPSKNVVSELKFLVIEEMSQCSEKMVLSNRRFLLKNCSEIIEEIMAAAALESKQNGSHSVRGGDSDRSIDGCF